MKKIASILFAITLVFSGVFTGCSSGNEKQTESKSNSKTKVVNIGAIRALGTVIPYVGKNNGEFQKQGINPKIVDFKDGPTLMQAFATGKLDVAYLGIVPVATWQEKGIKLKVVSSANGGGHVLLTREDTGINTLEDLKGKKIGDTNPGSVVDTLLRSKVLKENAKLDPDKDVKIITGLAPADMPTALMVTKEVDAVITWEPFATQAQSRFKGVKVLYDAASELKKVNNGKPFYPVNVVIATQSFIDKHPDVLKEFLKAHSDTVNFINNNPDKANGIIADELKLNKDIVAKARQRIDYTWQINTDDTLQTLKWTNELGYIKNVPSKDKLFDLNYLPKK
jgi:NitT/TauT family transport system substrate-binding protein